MFTQTLEMNGIDPWAYDGDQMVLELSDEMRAKLEEMIYQSYESDTIGDIEYEEDESDSDSDSDSELSHA